MEYPGEVSRKPTRLSEISGQPSESMDWGNQPSRVDELVFRTQNGDLAAFNELVLSYQDLVYRQAFSLLKEEEAAEDAVQDTFLKAYRKIHTFCRGKSFRPWLLRIATNHCLDMIRAAQRHRILRLEPVDPDGEEMEALWMRDPADTPEQAVEKAEVKSRITRAIQRLTSKYQTVVILVDLQNMDYAEVSAVLEVPLGTMKSRLSRARQQLRKALQ